MTGLLQTYNMNVIYWMTRRQTAVTADICHGELYAINSGLRHRLVRKNLLDGLDLLDGPDDKIVPMYSDNRAAITLIDKFLKAKSAFYHPSLLHAMDAIKRGELVMEWVAGKEKRADLLTKFVDHAQFKRFFSMLNIRPYKPVTNTEDTVNEMDEDGQSKVDPWTY